MAGPAPALVVARDHLGRRGCCPRRRRSPVGDAPSLVRSERWPSTPLHPRGRLPRRGRRRPPPRGPPPSAAAIGSWTRRRGQLLGEFVVSLRPPDQLPTPEESRLQFRRMVDLFDGPPPSPVRTRDLACPGPDGEVPLRLFEPGDAGSPAPLLLYLHGGGWVQGDLDTHRGVCGKLAAWAGCKVLAVHYRLAPEHKFPAGLETPRRLALAHGQRRGTRRRPGPPRDRRRLGRRQPHGRRLPDRGRRGRAGARRPAPHLPVRRPRLGAALSPRAGGRLVLPRVRVLWYTGLYLASAEQVANVRASPLRAESLRGSRPP